MQNVYIIIIFFTGIHTTNRELKELMCSKNDPLEKMRRIFEQHLMKKHPPVFQEWFRRVFSDPYGWLVSHIFYYKCESLDACMLEFVA